MTIGKESFRLLKRRNFRISGLGTKVLTLEVRKFNDIVTGYEREGHWVVNYVGERNIPGDRAGGGKVFTGSCVGATLRLVFGKIRRVVALQTNPKFKRAHERLKSGVGANTVSVDFETKPPTISIPAGKTYTIKNISGGPVVVVPRS